MKELQQTPEQPDISPHPTRAVNVQEAASLVGLSTATLNTLRSRGGGPPFAKLGRRVVYRVEDLLAWVEARVRTSTAG